MNDLQNRKKGIYNGINTLLRFTYEAQCLKNRSSTMFTVSELLVQRWKSISNAGNEIF
jgi:hypothetical protein